MNIKIIKDPVSGKQYSRDLDTAGSTFQPYAAPAVPPVNTGKTNEQVLAESTAAATKAQQVAGLPSSAYTPPAISTPTTAPNLNTIETPAPTLPTPTAPATTDNYYNSLSTQLTDTQKALKELQDRQLADTQSQKAATQQQLDELRILQENNIVAQGSSALTEKQSKLDLLAEEKARFDENYKSVQGLAGQLTSLVSQGQDIIGKQKELTIPQVFRSQKINQTLSDISAQTGVIQAAISAYSGNMSQAQSQLTNATNVITSAYNDEMDYYKTLNDFYESKSADTNQKLITLTTGEKSYIDNRITELENQKKIIEDNKQKLQDIFLDPDKALKFAKAGITIATPQNEWGKKLADQSYAEEVQKTSQDMANSGFSYLSEGQTAPAGTTTQTITDSKGVQKTWYKKGTGTTTATKPATAAQQTVSGYAARAEQANAIIDDFGEQIVGMNYVNFKLQSMLPSAFQSSDFQQYDQAARNFINSVLRPESGAAIAQSEFDNAYKQYIPQAGDSVGTLAQKADNRRLKIESLKQAAGSAYSSPENLLNQGGNQSAVGESEIYTTPDGVEYIKGEDGLYYPK